MPAPPKKRLARSYDTELTGLDLWHGCLPFSMQFCDENGDVKYFRWRVDPVTRIPDIDPEELRSAWRLIEESRFIITHNAKIDMRAMDRAYEHLVRSGAKLNWKPDWSGIQFQDTLIKSHAYRNLWSHSLKDLRDVFFHVSRAKQDNLRKATDLARKIADSSSFKSKHGTWRIAKVGDPHWPGIKKAPKEPDEEIEGWWLFDTWLPLEIAERAPEFLPPGTATEIHPWRTVDREYAIEDVVTTFALNDVMDIALKDEGLEQISETRHKLIQITYDMETVGVHIFPTAIKTEKERYRKEAARREVVVKQTAAKYGLEDFNLDSPKQVQNLIFNLWKLPILKKTEAGQPSTDAKTIEKIGEIVRAKELSHIQGSQADEICEWIDAFISSKRNDKSLDYLGSYEDWSVSHNPFAGVRLHSMINITGTKFTRQSTNGPNLQNVGTGKDVIVDGESTTDFLLRTVFGPPPGKHWLSIDFQSIEFLIWGYSCKNQQIIECYEQGLPLFKPIMEAVWGFFDKEDKKYKRTKNGIYSRLYGSSAAHSDETFGKEGAVAAIEARLPEVKAFTKKLYAQLRTTGYIETLGEYRLHVEADEPHKAVSAYVQGHAGWVIGEAMIACYEYLRSFPEIYMILQIHDELIFEGPADELRKHADNLGKIMSTTGERYGIPTPVNKSIITTSWAEATAI